MSADSSQTPISPKGGTIVFDLDGTLVDSVRDLLPALNFAIAQEGVPPVEQESIGKVVGQGALRMIEQAYSLHRRDLTPETHQQLLHVFLERYEAHVADETVFFEGCLEALDRLNEKGWLLAVCTNKYEGLARKLLNALGETQRFAALTGGNSFAFKKPDGRHIARTVELAGGKLEASVMVGDSLSDIAGAKNAGIPVIAVDFGYTDVPVTELAPDRVISHFNDFDTSLAKVVRK